jgi:acyl carrier protein
MELPIIEKIIEIVNSNIDKVTLTLDQVEVDLSQHGMDSITFIKIVVALEEVFDIEVPDEKLLITEMGTINKMVDVVSTALAIVNE